MTQEVIDEGNKLYKENAYTNTKGDFFGVSIKGRAKDYLQAHKRVQELIQKGKIYDIEYIPEGENEKIKGKFKFLSVVKTNLLLDTIIEVTAQDGRKGKVVLKSYYPSNNKKKGATTEMRKHSDYDYAEVKIMKAMLTSLLDKFIAEETGQENDEVWSCDICDYKAKSNSGLKTHRTKIHKTKPYNCDDCAFAFKTRKDLESHIESMHEKEDKRKRKLSEPIQTEYMEAPSTSPLRKKSATDDQIKEKDNEQYEDNSMEVEIADLIDDIVDKIDIPKVKNDHMEMLAKVEFRIKQLESELLEEKKKNEMISKELKSLRSKSSDIGGFTETLNKKPFKIPVHLKSVQEKHLTRLKGFKMRYCSIPDGACLTNCLTAHISCTEDIEERKINNRRVNNHIADNFDKFYSNKIILPYIETVGVGMNSRKVVCKTREEFLDFLRSEDSLCVFSNSQELLAIANMLNITIRIFSYGVGGDETRCEWSEVSPDPEMASTAHFPKGWVPDMYLYHGFQSHYDLLVAESHRIALLGLVGATKEAEVKTENEQKQQTNSENDEWRTINSKGKTKTNEKRLKDHAVEDYDDVDIEELDDEAHLLKAKQSGHRRVSPSDSPQSVSKQSFYRCSWRNCGKKLESHGLLEAHMKEHRILSINQCEKCEGNFPTKADLRAHVISEHEGDEWNCDDCSFQASSSGELMKHLKLKGHQPSKEIQDPNTRIIVCYTCKEEFSSKWSLMNHRKQKHPSNKMCRYFLRNECIHGMNCWYRHDEKMDIDFPFTSLKAQSTSCDKVFETKRAPRKHKETEHSTAEVVNKLSGQDSYANVANNEQTENLVFQKGQFHTFPPDQIHIMETLKMILQKMNMMDAKLQNIQ